jgi:FAD synthase
MSDEFDVVHLGHDDVQAIINWAVSTAGIAMLMQATPHGTSVEEALQRLDGFDEAVSLIVDNIPEALMEPAATVATESYEDAVFEEAAVEEFRQELDDL